MHFSFRYNSVPLFNGNITLAEGRLGVRPKILRVYEVSGEKDKNFIIIHIGWLRID